jgi:TetR/AcrR family transcriptional regulator, ethionamide resistance regulator
MAHPVQPRRRGGPSLEDPGIPEAVLAATDELLADRPLSAITVRDILERAGVSRASFYFYFASKYAAAAALLARVGEEADSRFAATWAQRDRVAPRDAVRASLQELFDTWDRHTHLLVAAQEAGPEAAELFTVWQGFMAAFVERYAQHVGEERGAGRAVDGPDARELSCALAWMDERALHRYATDAGAPDREAIIDALTFVWMASLYGGDAATRQAAPGSP